MESFGQAANSIIQRNSIQNPSPRDNDANNQNKTQIRKSDKKTRQSEDRKVERSKDKSRDRSKQRKRKHKHRSRSESSRQDREKRKDRKDKKEHRDRKDYRDSRSRDRKSRKDRKRSSQYFENKGRKSKSRSERRSRHRKDSRDRTKKRDYERDRSRSSHRRRERQERERSKYVSSPKQFKETKQIKEAQVPKQVAKMPEQVPFQETTYALPGERRKRQRSRSPRDYYRRNAGGGNEAQFWDSHSWVPKLNYISNASSSAIINTKKMRRLQITNVPLQMGISADELNEAITQYMIKNYLTDNMNTCPILKLDVFEADRTVALELSSVEETCRICKLEKIELFKGSFCGIVRLGDSMYGSSLVSQAQTAAKAQAAAFAAISILQNKATKFDYTGGLVSIQSSNVLRVVNAVTKYMAQNLSADEWREYKDDLVEGFEAIGTVKHSWLVAKDQRMVCAQPGNLFIEFEKKEEAEKAMEQMQGRNFDERTLTLYYIPSSIYQSHFKPHAIEK